MKSFFRYVSKALAVVFALFVVLAIPLSLMTFNLGRVFFSPGVINEVSTEAIMETDLITPLVNQMSRENPEAGGEEPGLKNLFEKLETSEWRQIKQEILPDDLINEWVENVVDNLYGWLDSEEIYPQIQIDTSSIRQRLKGEQGEKVAAIIFQSLPPCGEEEMEKVASDPSRLLEPEAVLGLLCKIPAVPPEDQIQIYETVLERIAEEIPPEVNLSTELENSEGLGEGELLRAKEMIRAVRLGSRLILLLPLGFLFLVALFGVRSLAGLGGWWGVPILMGSGISLGSTYVYPRLAYRVFAGDIQGQIPSVLQTVVLKAMEQLSREVLLRVRWQSIVSLLVGLALLGLTALVWILQRSRRSAGSEPSSQDIL